MADQKTVLLVENTDDPDLQSPRIRKLNELGYEVYVATNKNEAFSRIHHPFEPPDMVICDLMIPMGIYQPPGFPRTAQGAVGVVEAANHKGIPAIVLSSQSPETTAKHFKPNPKLYINPPEQDDVEAMIKGLKAQLRVASKEISPLTSKHPHDPHR